MLDPLVFFANARVLRSADDRSTPVGYSYGYEISEEIELKNPYFYLLTFSACFAIVGYHMEK